MRIMFMCPFWGNEGLDFDRYAEHVKLAGYDGVEMGLPFDKNKKKAIVDSLKGQELLLVGQHYQTSDSDFSAHKSNFEKHLYNLADTGALFINSQTGKDFFSFEQNSELIELAMKISEETGMNIYHETHRSKFSFAAHITKRFLEAFEDLRLTLDISHWCVVAESLLENQAESVELALQRTSHIHSRIGFAEGPQIPDPRAPEWQANLQRHLQWWDKAIENAKGQNKEYFCIAPEFGPVPYMPTLPFTNMPVTSQWDVNLFMKELLKERYC